jgi:hypothetical protein
MEEITYRIMIESNASAAFPAVIESPFFNDTYMAVCTRHEDEIAGFDCHDSLLEVITLDSVNQTLVDFTSDLCDSMGVPLPHPNETLSLRFLSKHIPDHKPGGKKTKIRHIIADIVSLCTFLFAIVK